MSVLTLAAAVLAADAGSITVAQSWARPAAAGATGAAYMVITNTGAVADRLVGASSAVARKVEFHSTMVDEQGVATMRGVQAIELPPGGEARLAPGGLHMMLIGLTQPLKAGEPAFPLTLTFERAGEVTVEVAVQARPGAGGGMHGMKHGS
jgi:copper(I)-binding protein